MGAEAVAGVEVPEVVGGCGGGGGGGEEEVVVHGEEG